MYRGVLEKLDFEAENAVFRGFISPKPPIAVKCHICSNDLDELRSVMLRQWLAEYESWGVTIAPPAGGASAYEQYCRNMTYRRAFICESCYLAVDGDPAGCAEIPGLGKWNLASGSRRGRAAVYDQAKWERFQRSKAKSMGLSY